MTIPIRCNIALLLATALAGCSLAPTYVDPALPVPPSWPVGDAYLRQSEAKLPAITYRHIFKDARLQALIDQALVNNRDLRVAAANIEATRAQYRIQRADLLPQVDATGRYTYLDRGNGAGIAATGGNGTGTTGTGTGTGGAGTGGTGTTPGAGAVVTGGSSGSSYSVNLGTTAFELDLFGRIRSLTDAALDRYFATEAAARATRLTLVGDIATAWVNYAADQSLLEVASGTA